MPKAGQNEIITQRFRRNFVQQGGPRPSNPLAFAGVGTQHMVITALSVPDSGDVTLQHAPDPHQPGGLRTVARTKGVPDPASATFVLTEKANSLPWTHFKQNCPFNVYEAVGGPCSDLSDYSNGWSAYTRVFSYAEISTRDFGALQDWESDDQNTVELSTTLENVYSIGPLSFGLEASSTIAFEVTDVVFGTKVQCGDCGVPNDGTNFIYASVKGASSPATKPAVVYTVNGGSTWSSVSVATAATGEDIKAIGIVGSYLVLLSATGGTASASCLYVSQLNTVTGVPSSTFTKVTPSVFNATNICFDFYVKSQSEVFFVAAGGYVYKSTDVLTDMTLNNGGDTVTDTLARIHGLDEIIYAVGQNGSVIKSTNGGNTWAVTTTLPGAGSNTAVVVLDQFRAWVGNSIGVLYYTIDGGENWSTKSYSGTTPVGIQDIAFATDEVGYITYTTGATVGRIATTWTGGASWVASTSTNTRLGSVPTSTTLNRIALPVSNDPTVNVNTVAVGGLGTSPDGVLLLGVASRL